MGIAFAANVGRHRAFQLGLAQLLKRGGAEHGIIERGGAETDDGILVRAFESFLIRPRHPEREQAQHAARLLKARQRLPFALKHGNDRRVKWIGGGERLARAVHVELAGQLLPMLDHPIGVFHAGFHRLFGQHHFALAGHGAFVPLKQPAADDFGSLGIG